MTDTLPIQSKILITGAAGFIGFHLAKFMLERRYFVVGLDNLNSYYDPKLKEDRLDILRAYGNFVFYRADLKKKPVVDEVFAVCRPEYVVNLAAQAGVRYSIENFLPSTAPGEGLTWLTFPSPATSWQGSPSKSSTTAG